MPVFDADFVAHYGTPRRSGRYPWGSGEDGSGSQRNVTWLGLVQEQRAQGLTDKEIYEGMGMKSGPFRARMTLERSAHKREQIEAVEKLANKGVSNVEIGKRLGIPESTVRTLRAPGAKDKAEALLGTANMLKDEVARKQWVDVGAGVENHLGISKEKLSAAVAILKEQGYETHRVKVQQIGTGHETEFKVLGPPGTTQKQAWLDRDNISQIDVFSIDGGKKYSKTHDPIPVDPKRLQIRYGPDGGAKADGVIYVRPGAKDLSLGNDHYAQVRVQVGPGHYLKGMAVLKDDLPAGVDLQFNTNKSDTGDWRDALKPMKNDSSGLPFGAVVRQITENTGQDNEKNISAMNLVNGAGAWKEWSKAISTQVLSKQSPSLARAQLEKTQESRQKEFDEIKALTNPTVKKSLLDSFASETDSAAVHLNAVSITKDSAWHVILPVENMKPTDVFAPRYKDGTRVALVRYPHGGPFEIPELVVNNSHREARKIVGLESLDAIGIHPDVAERLSGADFDGDTVILIPNNSGRIKSRPALEGLKNFDAKRDYKAGPGVTLIKDMKDPTAQTGRLMGDVSNLITDMTIRGASDEKLARAVRHSMVVIDAEKHGLDYKRSEADHGIKALKDEFQFDPSNPKGRGASTLISRATAEREVPDRELRKMRDGGPVDPKTGALVYVPTGKTRKQRDGTVKEKTIKVERLANTHDAHTLSTGTPIEKLYADHSNKLKSMANEARLESLKTPNLTRSRAAQQAYAEEAKSLASKLHNAQLNAPRERQAQVIANATIKAKKQANPHLDKEHIKRMSYQELELARKRTGAGKQLIDISDREWEAIQAGAVSNARLKEILRNADIQKVKELATPRPKLKLGGAKGARAKTLAASGKYSRAEIAAQLGVSLSTLDRTLDGDG